MKIAYFTDTFFPQINGVTNTFAKLEAYLNKNNIESLYIAPSYTNNILEEKPNVLRLKSCRFFLYPECRVSLPEYSRISKALEAFKPDMIHLVTAFNVGLTGLKYARRNNIPLVSSYHTNFDTYLKYYRLRLFEKPLWSFFKWFHKHSRVNFCPSQDTLEILKSKGIERLKIWARGIDTNLFSPDMRDEALRKKLNPDGKIMFAYVGRIALEKDLDILAESMKIILDKYHDQAVFIITGDGPYTDKLKAASNNRAVFTGYLRGTELSRLYASCDVFVFPSSTETFGNVVMEAMASGLPVVTVNSGGVTDSVKDGYNGFLCKPRDAQSFSEAIARLIENPGLIREMSQSAREYTITRSWDNIFDQLIADYKLALAEETHLLHA